MPAHKVRQRTIKVGVRGTQRICLRQIRNGERGAILAGGYRTLRIFIRSAPVQRKIFCHDA